MATTSLPLTATEEAYLTLILADHAAAIQGADARKNERVNILLRDKGIPQGIAVGTVARTEQSPACLTYDIPDPVSDPISDTPTDN